MMAAGTVLESRYRVERLLGEGGMSRVYLARHLELDQPVALKVVQSLSADSAENQRFAEQLQVEARIMASLDHPNLAAVLDFFRHGGAPVLVMEFIEGRDLQQTIELAPKPLSERKTLEWTAVLLDVLEYLHGRQPPVIVRDLKPANVMLGKDGRLRLIDFGLAKLSAPGHGTRPIVRGMGSEGYAPLEQYGNASTDARSDLYAAGAVMYFLLTDQAPPPAVTRLAEGVPVVDPRNLNKSVSERTWSVIQRLLAIKPDDRPDSAAEVRRMLGLGESSTRERIRYPRPGRVCGACWKQLKLSRYLGIRVDYCPGCKGVWLDDGELEEIVRRAGRASGGKRNDTETRQRQERAAKPPQKQGKKRPSTTRWLWRQVLDLLDLE